MMKLVLLRHGESEWNKLNLFTGWTDVELSETGVQEAKNAGQLLKKEGYDFDLCFTSYLKRAIHTLNNCLAEMDREWLPVVKAWQLNERHYGALQGLNKSETAAKYGEDQVKIWRRSFDVPPPPRPKTDPKQPALNDGERMGRVNRTGVNIRSDHSTKNTRVLTKMSNKDVVILDTWQGEGSAVPWYKIRLDNGGEGWVYGKYVELK